MLPAAGMQVVPQVRSSAAQAARCCAWPAPCEKHRRANPGGCCRLPGCGNLHCSTVKLCLDVRKLPCMEQDPVGTCQGGCLAESLTKRSTAFPAPRNSEGGAHRPPITQTVLPNDPKRWRHCRLSSRRAWTGPQAPLSEQQLGMQVCIRHRHQNIACAVHQRLNCVRPASLNLLLGSLCCWLPIQMVDVQTVICCELPLFCWGACCECLLPMSPFCIPPYPHPHPSTTPVGAFLEFRDFIHPRDVETALTLPGGGCWNVGKFLCRRARAIRHRG